jgi:hypothetical protein
MADPAMPLQNRVTPSGEIIATPARGTMMGNRGGAFHTAERTLTHRRWKTKAWICCVLQFKGRRRVVMTPNRYTELFFLDEATALAAGHRPCFECRRVDAVRFAEAWQAAMKANGRPSAPDMDKVLHAERMGKVRAANARIRDLPNGTFVTWQGQPHLVLARRLRPWTVEGYARALDVEPAERLAVLTPPTIVAALSAGYWPMVHVSAQTGW